MLVNSLKFSLIVLSFAACTNVKTQTGSGVPQFAPSVSRMISKMPDTKGLETATLAGGCFWKMDACYQQLNGVVGLEVGYAGGKTMNPTYEEVSTRTTGHAETIKLVFDPKIVSYREILEVFWNIHDPTVLNREGNDAGDDYRSVVFYHNEEQKKTAEMVKDSILKTGLWSKIVTTTEPYTKFYRGEEYHQNYYFINPNEGYTGSVVRHKVELFEERFKAKMKPKA